MGIIGAVCDGVPSVAFLAVVSASVGWGGADGIVVEPVSVGHGLAVVVVEGTSDKALVNITGNPMLVSAIDDAVLSLRRAIRVLCAGEKISRPHTTETAQH